jgi:tight adherence protein C
MQFWKWLIGAGSIAVIAAVTLHGVMLRVASRQRLAEYQDRDENETELDDEARGPVGRWLALAGYRSPQAVGAFWTATAAMSGLGAVLAVLARGSGVLNVAIQGLESIPGAVGEIFVPVIQYAPWILIVILALAPCLVVRARRRRIVMEVEQDLPLVLELLATLGESGLGFDAAIARIIDSQPGQRPLTTELRNFQRETLTGRPRVASLRRLARRIDVQSLTIFISAVVHAEQVGSGVSDVLRRQADDVRDRRRERALNLAQSLPVKLLFPLVICFLPAIFVFTLGPIFLQFFEFAEALLNRRSVR